jgi:hypothetical protein
MRIITQYFIPADTGCQALIGGLFAQYVESALNKIGCLLLEMNTEFTTGVIHPAVSG